MSDTDRIALVTGANSGIGFEIAKQLIVAGFNLLVGARDEARGAEAAGRLGPSAESVQIDVTDEASIASAAMKVDRLEVLVNNAGINPGAEDIVDTSVEQFRRAFETNVFGLVAVTQAFLPALRGAAHPRIVNLSSGTGSLTWNSGDNPQFDWQRVKGGGVAYRTSKTAVNAITLLTSPALQSDGILVNALAPGAVEDEPHCRYDHRRRPRRGSRRRGATRSAARRGADRVIVVLGRHAGPVVTQARDLRW